MFNLNHEMKMVTYFNKKDLVKFGEYLLSDLRKKRILYELPEKLDPKPVGLSDSEKLSMVYHADIENWLVDHKEGSKIESLDRALAVCASSANPDDYEELERIFTLVKSRIKSE